jgi:large subunit ribosomal protein L9
MTMKLLLRETVENLGKSGDIVSVANGYGRNYLLPRHLAMEVTPGNMKRIEAEAKRRQAREVERLKGFKALAERIASIDITRKERVAEGDQLYGSVSARDLQASLAEESVHVELEMIRLEEPIKSLGVHRVAIRLHPEVDVELKVWVVGIKDNEPVH